LVKDLAKDEFRKLYKKAFTTTTIEENDTYSVLDVLHRKSNIFIFDNHDVYNNWGSEKLTGSLAFTRNIALEVYNEICQSCLINSSTYYYTKKIRNILLCVTDCRSNERGIFLGKTQEDYFYNQIKQKLNMGIEKIVIYISCTPFPIGSKDDGFKIIENALFKGKGGESSIKSNECVKIMDWIKKIKELMNDTNEIILISGDSHTIIQGTIKTMTSLLDNHSTATDFIDVYTFSPISQLPLNTTLTTYVSSTDTTEEFNYNNMIGLSNDTNLTYIIESTFKIGIRNYGLISLNDDGTLSVEHIIDENATDHTTLNQKEYTRYLAGLFNINIGTLYDKTVFDNELTNDILKIRIQNTIGVLLLPLLGLVGFGGV